MRKIYPKISAIVAMLMTILSFGLLAASGAFLGVEPPPESAYSASSAFWIYAVLVLC